LAVIHIQTVLSAYPEEPAAILNYLAGIIAGKTVCRSNMTKREIILSQANFSPKKKQWS
jgi:hypothetical protein